MINAVLETLDRLQSDLAAIDPARDLAAADRVADIARSLRRSLHDTSAQDGTLSGRLIKLNRITGRAA